MVTENKGTIKVEAVNSLENLSEGDLIEFDSKSIKKFRLNNLGFVNNIDGKEKKVVVYTAHKRECGVVGFERGLIKVHYVLKDGKLKKDYFQSFFAFDNGFN